MSTNVAPIDDPALVHLRSLAAVRETTTRLLDAALKTPSGDGQGVLKHFRLDMSKVDSVADFVLDLMRRDYPAVGAHPATNGRIIDGIAVGRIPPHSRWRHFDAGGIKRLGWLLQSWKSDSDAPMDLLEPARRALDLTFVSVLLDAGAGDTWKYEEKSAYGDGHHAGGIYTRSEGLAIASLDMFREGLFSSDPNVKCRVDSSALLNLPFPVFTTALQHHPANNPLAGVDSRHTLLTRLGAALSADPVFTTVYCGVSSDGKPLPTSETAVGRPGHILDYLLAHSSTSHTVATGSSETPSAIIPLSTLWYSLTAPFHSFPTIWPPSRTRIAGVAMGDAWPCDALSRLPATTWVGGGRGGERTDHVVAFHKLTQWLVYSLVEVMEACGGDWVGVVEDATSTPKLGKVKLTGTEALTGLAEYRNGGLLIDLNVLSLQTAPPTALPPIHPLIIEWRALTVPLLDLIAQRVRERLGVSEEELPLAKVLEGGTWKAGREVAKKLRGATGGGPPVGVVGDGTVF
ncbi:DUF1688-domain-containing protein [Gonapodya prolifera JEL478]|uniref:DUF1688-domain-containing protein n=1 Tax=Gonapodya prolifera (strain JEL478) TaxID=1344416 RepID=A0A139B0H8_GONPJ|nr:DUF1688-domain-containing protein [Gonapodya prolifera JEL478]|eukprot:KXS22502.1 DUF1688-domain-containing protein [Gonapodya prolifera JEL478]